MKRIVVLVICLAFCLSISVSASANGGTATNIGGAGYIRHLMK